MCKRHDVIKEKIDYLARKAGFKTIVENTLSSICQILRTEYQVSQQHADKRMDIVICDIPVADVNKILQVTNCKEHFSTSSNEHLTGTVDVLLDVTCTNPFSNIPYITQECRSISNIAEVAYNKSHSLKQTNYDSFAKSAGFVYSTFQVSSTGRLHRIANRWLNYLCNRANDLNHQRNSISIRSDLLDEGNVLNLDQLQSLSDNSNTYTFAYNTKRNFSIDLMCKIVDGMYRSASFNRRDHSRFNRQTSTTGINPVTLSSHSSSSLHTTSSSPVSNNSHHSILHSAYMHDVENIQLKSTAHCDESMLFGLSDHLTMNQNDSLIKSSSSNSPTHPIPLSVSQSSFRHQSYHISTLPFHHFSSSSLSSSSTASSLTALFNNDFSDFPVHINNELLRQSHSSASVNNIISNPDPPDE
jgi:hypothetical protein